FRVQVDRRDEAVLPVVPKDIVLVQDSSRSLAEERLYFCRQALREVLATLQPADRFNVVKFNDRPVFCFEGWQTVDETARARAAEFIANMRSEGETDVFASISALRSLPRDPRRPMIAVVVTDGNSTTGVTASTQIIGEFTKLNPGGFSVFALGTHGNANGYLLDMLTYCNRGASSIVASGRWDIPSAIQSMFMGVARPVLGDVEAVVDLASGADIHPLPAGNLYSDRPLEFYGSCPNATTNLVLQVRGQGGEAKCDVIFNLDLKNAPAGGDALRAKWARRKMHSLIGAYARQPTDALLIEMHRLSREYRLPIPYKQAL
ncbi:MAG: VWA domain-containing protein, partial [Kiritimatiellae bacterium]|nr:VWA domain-containing protein [Kiritimatiellia bacterium]